MSRAPAAKTSNINSIPSPVEQSRGAQQDRSPKESGAPLLDLAASLRTKPSGLASPAASEYISIKGRDLTTSPDKNGRRTDDLLSSAASNSSVPTSASSVFSTNMSHAARNPSLHTLTPLTSTDSSPPGKLPSPRHAKQSHETMDAPSYQAPSSASVKNIADTITPVHTPPDVRISIWPADGKLGQRLNYDPMLDTKLDKKAKHGRGPTYKPILDKVREGHTYISVPLRGVVL
jgi:histone-lysine N-methyltransferase SETD1